ncbi:MAG: DEAD/DEAH box helicase [Desulfosarcinaceae bacterium]|nr:DEAD/DEAH box helicase [Desulfosarcinaceae bacterium]
MTNLKTPLQDFLTAFRDSPTYGRQLIDAGCEPERPPHWTTDPLPLSDRLRQALKRGGIERLYRHQAAALDAISAGTDTVVATPTASGKSLVYQLAMLSALEDEGSARGLFLYPLKALAQDQCQRFRTLAETLDLANPAAIYDGDTPAGERRRIRQQPPAVLFSNPEMLHLSLLPHHDAWAALWRGLRLVVIDEAHVYRGIAGSHMAALLQRLLRMAAAYGSRPRFVFTSATIANPDHFCQQLLGRPVYAVSESGCARPRCHQLLVDPDRGAVSTAIDLLRAALHRRLRTIVFTPSRKLAEVISQAARDRSTTMAGTISPYRAGYTPAERRQIEGQLARGELLAVVTTSALELGIDIGDLDLCILVGYPGTRIATRQRAGRVGRRHTAAAVVLIAGEDALDAYFLRHPQQLWQGETERAVLNPLNSRILAQHLICAAAELPLDTSEPWLTTAPVAAVADSLRRDGRLRRRADETRLLAREKRPHRHVHLRTHGRPLPIWDAENQRLIGDVDRHRAPRDTHPGAVYLHRGDTYLIETLDLVAGKVTARPRRVGYTTRARTHGRTEIVTCAMEREIAGTKFFFGQLRVEEQVVAYDRVRKSDGKKLARVDLDLPAQRFDTEGLWFRLDAVLLEELVRLGVDPMGALHAAEHLLIALFPLQVLADRNDVGGLSTNYHPQTGTAAIFIYDGIPGGAGLCQDAFERVSALLEEAIATVAACACERGCPACVHSPKCGSGNDPLDKRGAKLLLEAVLASNRGGPNEAPPLSTALPERSPAHRVRGPRRYGVLDLETQRSAEEVGGWRNADRMGLSCAVLYDSARDAAAVYWERDVDRLLRRLDTLDLVVGFNLLRFDYRVLRPYLPDGWRPWATLDILEQVRQRLGYRRSLAHLAQETLNSAKTGDGLQALRWWRQGRLAELADYCRRDVALTHDLYRYGRRHGHLIYRDPEGQRMEVPVDFPAPVADAAAKGAGGG